MDSCESSGTIKFKYEKSGQKEIATFAFLWDSEEVIMRNYLGGQRAVHWSKDDQKTAWRNLVSP